MKHQSKGLSVLLAALAAVSPCIAACNTEQPLGVKVREFHARELRLIDAIFELGRATEVCFGVESLDPILLRSRTDFDVYDKPVSYVLREILAQAAGLEVAEHRGVVLIRRKRAPSPNWLDAMIDKFSTPPAPLQAVNNALHMTVMMKADPSIQGFAGSHRTGDASDVVGPFEEHGKTLRDLLCGLVGRSRGGLWIVYGAEAHAARPKRRFWEIYEYTTPPDDFAAEIRQLPISPEPSATTATP